jgi:DNA-binding winged helix-turn-helix (wHTH) protein
MDAYDELKDIESAEVGTLAHVEDQSHLGRSADMLRFSDFVLIPKARLLLRCDRPVDIGSRAFDLLVVLAERRGELVSKQTIISFVWPTTLVEESNLRFQMVLLRKVLGSERHLIKTIPGRGYLLAMDGPQDMQHRTGQLLKHATPHRSDSSSAAT